MAAPSISTLRFAAKSWNTLAAERSWLSVVPLPSAVEASEFNTGKNSATPTGTVHLRVADAKNRPGAGSLAMNDAPRNQTWPDWPARQSAVSNNGCPSTGIENAHCHQRALH